MSSSGEGENVVISKESSEKERHHVERERMSSCGEGVSSCGEGVSSCGEGVSRDNHHLLDVEHQNPCMFSICD